jgi:hypothetical protein
MNSRLRSFFHRPRAAMLVVAGCLCLGAAPAEAQLFNWLDSSIPAEQIVRMIQTSGYRLTAPLIRRGEVYVADVVGRRNKGERLIISAQDGRLLQRFASTSSRRRVPESDGWQNPPQQQSNLFSNWFNGDDEDAPRPPAGLDQEDQPLRVAPVAPARAPAVKEIARQDESGPHVILAPSFQPNGSTNAPLLEKPRIRPQQARRRRPEPTPAALPAAPGNNRPAAIQAAAPPATTTAAAPVQSAPVVESKASRATVLPAAPAPKAAAAKPALNDVPVAPLQ